MRRARAGRAALWLAACLAWAAAAAAAQEPQATPSPAPSAAPDRPVAAVDITGVTRLDKETVWQTIGVQPGGVLRRDPAELAALLEDHYRTLGYAAVRVQARFDEASSTLSVTVDEGVLGSVEVTGVPAGERARVLEVLELSPGKPFNDEEVADALRRLDSATSGAFEGAGDPPYELGREDGAVRLSLQLRHNPARFRIGPGGTGRAALFNRVDGFAPGISTEALVFAPSAFNPIELYGLANYGFAAERVRYAAGALRRFGRGGPVVLGYEHHDFTDSDDAFRASGVERLGGWHIFFTVFQDYYRRRGDELFAFARPAPRLQVGVNFRSDTYESQPVVSDGTFLINVDPPENPAVANARSRSLLFTARWALAGPLFESWKEERAAFLVRDPYGTRFLRAQRLRVEGTFETADADALGGDLTFRRFTGHARGAARLSLRNWLLGRVTFGAGSDLPPQRRFSLGGQGTLRGRQRNEVEGDRMVLVTAEWQFEPNSPLPALIAFYDGGTAWDSGADEKPPWRHDVGLGLAWPPGDTRYVRVDAAVPLNAVTGSRTVRVTGHVRLPF